MKESNNFNRQSNGIYIITTPIAEGGLLTVTGIYITN